MYVRTVSQFTEVRAKVGVSLLCNVFSILFGNVPYYTLLCRKNNSVSLRRICFNRLQPIFFSVRTYTSWLMCNVTDSNLALMAQIACFKKKLAIPASYSVAMTHSPSKIFEWLSPELLCKAFMNSSCWVTELHACACSMIYLNQIQQCLCALYLLTEKLTFLAAWHVRTLNDNVCMQNKMHKNWIEKNYDGYN